MLDSRKRRADLLDVAGGSITAGDAEDSIDGEGPDAAADGSASGMGVVCQRQGTKKTEERREEKRCGVRFL